MRRSLVCTRSFIQEEFRTRLLITSNSGSTKLSHSWGGGGGCHENSLYECVSLFIAVDNDDLGFLLCLSSVDI